jgi:lysophospholipid hydrolase
MPTFLWQLFVFCFHVVPSVLYWVITFTTITLPTWLFTLFSMSLTFTMNFTTLYDPKLKMAPNGWDNY